MGTFINAAEFISSMSTNTQKMVNTNNIAQLENAMKAILGTVETKDIPSCEPKYIGVTYENFEDVKNDIAASLPPIIYKYRNWDDKNHKRIITEKELWFAHPHSLNDPHDIRPLYRYVLKDLASEVIKEKLYNAGRAIEPYISDEQLAIEVEIRLQAIQKDPIQYFRHNRASFVLDTTKYDNFGVLSFCSSFDNEPVWTDYGNDNNGFAIGFNTVKLAKSLNCVVGNVEYSDTPLDYFIGGDNSDLRYQEMFQKSTNWSAEQEIRFVTVGIDKYRSRASSFPTDAVDEIVFGLNTPQATQDEIMEEATKTMPGISFYKLSRNQDSFGFRKMKL